MLMFDPENPKKDKPQYTYDFPMPVVTVDMIVIGTDKDGKPWALLIKRGKEPYKGDWALPGGHVDVDIDKTLLDAAERELKEETGIDAKALGLEFHQVGAFGDIDRDPRGRYVTIAFVTVIDGLIDIQHGDDAADARWVKVDTALSMSLAWDHNDILKKIFDEEIVSVCFPDAPEADDRLKVVDISDLDK